MKKLTTNNEKRILRKQNPSKKLTTNSPECIGTISPRLYRAIDALLEGAKWREELDRIAGCSNSPALIENLRKRGLDVECERVPRLDRDGRQCRPGLYSLTATGRKVARAWLVSRQWASDGERA